MGGIGFHFASPFLPRIPRRPSFRPAAGNSRAIGPSNGCFYRPTTRRKPSRLVTQALLEHSEANIVGMSPITDGYVKLKVVLSICQATPLRLARDSLVTRVPFSVLSQRFINIFQGPSGAPQTLRPRRGRVRHGGHRSVVANPEQGHAVLDGAPGVGGVSLGPGICLRTSNSPHWLSCIPQ